MFGLEGDVSIDRKDPNREMHKRPLHPEGYTNKDSEVYVFNL